MGFYCGSKNKPNKGSASQCYKRGIGVGMNLAYTEIDKKTKSISENIIINDNQIENILNQSRIANKELEQSFNLQFDFESEKLAKRLAERNLKKLQVAKPVNNLDKIKKILKNAIEYSVENSNEVVEKLQSDIKLVSTLFEMESNNTNESEFQNVIKELVQLLNEKLELLYGDEDDGAEYNIDNNPIDIHAQIKKDIKAKNALIKQEFRDSKQEGVQYDNKLDISDFLEQLTLFKQLFPDEKKLIKDLTGLKSAIVKEEKIRNNSN